MYFPSSNKVRTDDSLPFFVSFIKIEDISSDKISILSLNVLLVKLGVSKQWNIHSRLFISKFVNSKKVIIITHITFIAFLFICESWDINVVNSAREIEMIERNFYLQQIISKMWDGNIKVITGIRRCGKSTLLFDLFNSF